MLDLVKKWCPAYGTHHRVVLGIAVLACFYVLSQHNYLLFHSIVEISAVVVGCAVFVLFWNTRRYLDNGFFLFLGIACLFSGILDLMHVLTHPGMSVIPGTGGGESIQFKTAGRWIAGLSFLAAPLFLRRRLRLGPTLAAYSIVLGLIFWLVLGNFLPKHYTEQGGMTLFEHANRGLTCMVFLAAAAVLAAKRKTLNARVFKLILASLIASAGSEFASALAGDFDGFLKVVAHLCEVLSLYLTYMALSGECIWTLLDITALREAQALARRLSRAVEQTSASVVMTDLKGAITFVNQSFCRTTGYTEQEALGQNPRILKSGNMPASLYQEMWKALTQGRQWRGELQNRRKNGDLFWESAVISPVTDEEGTIANYVAVKEDISERKRAEGLLMTCAAEMAASNRALEASNRRAEAANRAKSEFLANMSHEIRTPMTSILGYTDLLLDDALGAALRKTYLTTVRRNGERLLQLINDILDLSKIEAGKMLMEAGPCQVSSTVAEVAGMMRPHAEQRKSTLEVRYATPLPETIHTDGARLRQVIVNLVGNAVKFTENGSIRISVSFLPQWRSGQSAVSLEVTDTGIGISQEALPHLFQPFTQAESSTTRKYGGSGLGLAISRQIVTALSGELTVQSVPGEGSTFTVTIPTGDLAGVRLLQAPGEALGEDQSGAQWMPGGNALRGVKILLADDSLDNQVCCCTVLGNVGAEVQVVENGRLAIERAQAGAFDVLLMDMNMPEMDGYDATRRLRDRGYQGPILALTANAMSGDCERCLAAGCNAHLAKPIDRKQLILAVAHYATSRNSPAHHEAPLAAQSAEAARSLQSLIA